jgi:hypothetical protein
LKEKEQVCWKIVGHLLHKWVLLGAGFAATDSVTVCDRDGV